MVRRVFPLTLALGAAMALALTITAVAAITGAFEITHIDPSAAPITDLSALWTVPPVEVALTAVLTFAYLAWSRDPDTGIRMRHRLFFLGGIVLLSAVIVTPLGGMAQQGLLAAHMVQHTVIGAFVPLFLLLGIPPDLAVKRLSPTTIRRIQKVQHPAVAFTIWTLTTFAWLVPAIHHQVLTHPALWVVQQISFLAFGVLMWMPVLERVPAPEWFGTGWKGSYMSGVWTVGLVISNIYWFSGTAFYSSHVQAAVAWGISPLQDQANSGTVMMLTHCMLALGAVTLLFFRQAQEGSLRQRLLEAGLDRDRVEYAVRHGDGTALALAHGISPTTRGGID